MGVSLASICALLSAAFQDAPRAEQRKILERVGPSVVAIRNSEGYGSGMILDSSGLILTNAHVAYSPLPLWVEVEAEARGARIPCIYRRVTLVGVHPTKDLGLLRIEPGENPGSLTPIVRSTSPPLTGEQVYAVGFPSTYGGHAKVVLPGRVTSVDRFVDYPGNQEISAAVAPGNSGGPLVNLRGEAIGVITWGAFDKKPLGMAIPIFDLKTEKFGPIGRRAINPARASEMLAMGEDMLKFARENEGFGAGIAETFFRMAVVDDLSNPDIYAKIGMLARARGRYPSAAAHLVRALRLKPWSESRGQCYHELGVALVKMGKPLEGSIVWKEGLAKYPMDGTDLWDAMAVYFYDTEGNYLEAAYCSRASVEALGGRGEVMNTIYRNSRARLSVEDSIKLRQREEGLKGDLFQRKAAAEESRRSGKEFLTRECGDLIRNFEGAQKELLGGAGRAPNNGPTPEEYERRIVEALFKAGKGYLAAGRGPEALEFFEELVRDYPRHPEAKAARDYIEALKK
jgi:tetratricopeptide (TPR) repeat protein